MSVEDFLNAQPIPPMGPETLGLGPAPAPPVLPMPGQPQKRNPMDLAALALAAMLGPGKGTGILQGVQQAKQQQQQERAYQDRQQADLYRRQQEMYQWQQQQYEADATRRQNALESNVKALQSNLPTLKTKAAYDQTIDTFAAGLQQMGLRVDGNYLRSRVPYVAPDGTKSAVDAIERWKKNPQNEKLLKENPEQASIAKIPVDRDGDGVPEMLTLDEAMTLAGMPFTREENGKIAWAPAGTTQADKANADGIYADLLAKDQAEGKADTPERRIQLRAEAMRLAGNATRAPKDNTPNPSDYEWVLRNGKAVQIIKGSAQSGDQPYSATVAAGANGLTPNQSSQANKLADDFTRDSKDFISRAQSYNTILASAKDASPAGDLALIFSYMKMLDPGSTVREGEFANAQNAASVPDQIRNWYNRVRTGERLNPNQRKDFVGRAKGIFDGAKRLQDGTVRTYRQRAKISGVPEEMVIRDYAEGTIDQPKDNSDIEAALGGR